MSEAGIPPNVDRSGDLLAGLWVPWPFASMLLVTRFWSRIARKDLGWDDYFMLFSWVLYTTAVALSTVLIAHGGIRHIEYLSLGDLTFVMKLEAISEPIGMFALVFGKSSVALFIRRISGTTKKWRRWFLDVNVVLYFLVSIAVLGVMFGQCAPAKALWDVELRESGQAKCMNSTVVLSLYMLQGAWGAYLDFALATLPLTFLLELKIDLPKKIALCILLGLGVIAGVCATIKTWAFYPAQTSTDITWNGYALFLWTTLENAFLLIAGCIPPSKTIYDYWRNGKPISLTGASSTSASSKFSHFSHRERFSKISSRLGRASPLGSSIGDRELLTKSSQES
ncbi:hypothetical protein N7456_012117 [Penicillium angulare]|uniref:Rhodopsin domain-containing protein n=1 Tax=Penicillium angulare TaxID=116970 RepID=A0A9W9K0T4_9EURO|nr:hypothetical protein N7456_012117 [Penicillium angulare]